MNKYIRVTDLNEVYELKKAGKCYFEKLDGGYALADSLDIHNKLDYYKLNSDYREPLSKGEVVEKLEFYNNWRRGEESLMMNPKYIGEVIGAAIDFLKST
jgi:hypothetical protein